MRFPYIGSIRRRLTAKLTIPFIVVLVSALALLGFVSIRSSRAAMGATLDKRAEVVVTTLAAALADPLAMGEVDRVQHLIDRTKQIDPVVTYVVVLDAESNAIATTDPALRHQILTRNDFERAMAQASAFVSRPVPGSRDTFEVAAPIQMHGARAGILRIGVSTLIELMIVVALIGILTSIAFPLYTNVQTRVRIMRARADLRALASATAVYAANVGKLPASLNNLTVVVTATGKPNFGPLLKPLPVRPNTTWSNYTYTTLAVKGTFQIISSSAKDSASLKAP